MIHFFYDAGTPGAGGTLPPPLSDIEPRGFGFRIDPNPKPDDPIKGGDGTDKLPIVDPVPDPNKDKPLVPPEGKIYNDKGELIDDPNFKKVEPEPNKDEPNVDDDDKTDDGVTFWDTVNKLTGREVKVEYPADVDPISPEGVALRENAVRAQTEESYDARIRKEYPHAYAYMIHHMSGGSDAEFFDNHGSIALPERGTVESSSELQATFVKSDLLDKGVDPEIAQAHVDKLIKDNKLKDSALKVYDLVDKQQKDGLANLEANQRAAKQKQDQAISIMTSNVNKVLKNASFTIPEADMAKVSDFIANNLQYERSTGKFYLVQPVDQADMASQIDMMIYHYYKGDLNKIINKKARTEASQRLRLGASKTKTNTPSGGDPLQTPGGYIPLGQLGNGSK